MGPRIAIDATLYLSDMANSLMTIEDEGRQYRAMTIQAGGTNGPHTKHQARIPSE
jgi:hypothetical protein